ncbi:MAG: copper-binding protein [Alphaproteobacteria bacterium]|nr:copper-binding protein [Alphaproteobacteria bacterium]
MNTTRFLFAAAFGLSLSAAAVVEAGPAQSFPFGHAAKTGAGTRTVTVTMKDNVFEPETISVKAGETVRFVIRNKGDFLHEFALGEPDGHAKHMEMMKEMMDHGMITATGINHAMMKMDHSKMGHGAAHDHGPESGSVLVEPGKQAELTWKFTKAMNLEFACTVPGHYEAGMVGKISFGQ